MAATPRSAFHFPNELYREIATKLHQRRDKDVLLSLALVSNIWRHESQRVLFSSLSDDWNLGQYPNVLTHTLFLESILANPERLGPYVHLYAQNDISVNPFAIKDHQHQQYCEAIRLWDLTSRSLPAMINLKHLFIYASVSANSMAESFLVGCQFQLETLMWGCEEPHKMELIQFLCTQRVLSHFEVGVFAAQSNVSWLPQEMCPSLISTACHTKSIPFLECRRDIVALKTAIPYIVHQTLQLQNKCPSIMAQIKYLSVWGSPYADLFFWPAAPNVVLLQVQIWDFKKFHANFAENFPNIRVLAVLDGQDPELLVELSTLAFSQLPKLETIFIRPGQFDEEMPFGYHTKISLNRADPDAVIKIGWVLGECQLGLPWWSVYETMLEEHDPSFRILV